MALFCSAVNAACCVSIYLFQGHSLSANPELRSDALHHRGSTFICNNKQIQLSWPTSHGVDYFVVMFDGLHVERASLKNPRDFLEDNGWTGALAQVSFATPGPADSFLKAPM